MPPTCSSRGARRRSARRARVVLVAWGALALSGCAALTVPQERQLGDEFVIQIRREVRLFNERVVVDYIDRIGRLILAHAPEQPFDFTFSVVDDEEINAFAGPGGHIFINTGTILRARNLSELAGVIAHEIGHVAERHVAENYGRRRAASNMHMLGVLVASVFSPIAANAMDLGGGIAAMAVLNTFGREAEREADEFAVEALIEAGIDPTGMVSFFELLNREAGGRGGGFLSSHPAPRERVVNTREQIADEIEDVEGLRKTDGGRLEIIQSRIRLLTRKP